MKYLALWSPGLLNLFWKISKTLWPRCYILNVYSLIPKRCQTIFQDFQVSSFVWSRISKGEITNLEIPVVFPKQYVPYPHIYFWDSPIYRQQTNLRWTLLLVCRAGPPFFTSSLCHGLFIRTLFQFPDQQFMVL